MNSRKILSKESGFTLVELMIVVMIISVVLMIAVPSWLGARERSQNRACVSQLREIRYAKDSWAMENKKDGGDTPTWDDILVYIKTQPACPSGGDYDIAPVSELPKCSKGGEHVLY